MQAGRAAAAGFGYDTNATSVKALWDATLEVRVVATLSRWTFVRASAGAWLPLVRPHFDYQDAGGADQPIYQPPVVSWVASLGVGFNF
jgi:hypothetical protein